MRHGIRDNPYLALTVNAADAPPRAESPCRSIVLGAPLTAFSTLRTAVWASSSVRWATTVASEYCWEVISRRS
jgi:hypothetical protein